MLSVRVLLVLGSVAVLCAGPLTAESPSRFRLFGGAVWSSPVDDSRARFADEVKTVDLGDDIGWEAGFEWLLTPWIGVEASVARTSHTVRFGSTEIGQVDLEPIFVSLNFHLVERERWRWWVAPTVAFYDWKDSGFRQGIRIDDDRDEGLGATLGVDMALGERWSLTGALRYVDVQLGFDGGGEVAVDPLSIRAGAALRF